MRSVCPLLFALVVPASACGKAPEPSVPPTPAPVARSVPESKPSEPVTEAPSASSAPPEAPTGKKPRHGKPGAAAQGDLSPTPDPPSEADRVHSGASTRGKIACGDSTCTPGKETCVADATWHCVSSNALPKDPNATLDCDDGTDCPYGETCCFSFVSGLSARVCSKRRGPENDCHVEVCAEGGARCPKGQVCDHSVCRSPTVAATCRQASALGASPNKKDWRCPPDHPICSWSATSTRCVSGDEQEATLANEERASLVCTIPSDCGPESRCCTNGIWTDTQCLTNCDSSNNGEVCASDADCTSFAGKPAKGKCVTPSEVKSLPPWLKVCNFD